MEPSHTDFQDMQDIDTFEPAAPRAHFFTGKVAVWALLACMAAGYLAVIAIKPAALAGYIPSLSPWGSSPEDNEGQRATAANSPQALRDGLSQVQLDVAKIKAEMAEHDEHDKALQSRMAVLEDVQRGTAVAATAAPNQPVGGAGAPAAAPAKISAAEAAAAASVTAGVPITNLAPATPAATAAAKAAAKKAAAAAAKAVVAPAVPAALAPAAAAVPAVPAAALPVAKAAPNAAAAIAPPIATADPVAANGVKLINLPLSASSVASKAAPAPVAPAAPPANAAEALAPKLETGTLQNLGAVKPVGIYIGSGPSVDSVRQSWSLLADRNATTLGGLEPRYTTGIDANGLNYGLVAGPVKSVADAQKICRDLAAKAVTCRVGDFTGEAL